MVGGDDQLAGASRAAVEEQDADDPPGGGVEGGLRLVREPLDLGLQCRVVQADRVVPGEDAVRCLGEDVLAPAVGGVAEARAQGGVVAYEGVGGGPERRTCGARGEFEALGHGEPERLPGFAAVQVPALDRGERRLGRFLGGVLRGRGLPYAQCEFGDRLVAEDVLGGEGESGLPGAGDDLDAQDGVAAEREEVVAGADAFDAEHVGPDRGQALLRARPGSDVRRAAVGLCGRGGQGAPIGLAAGGARDAGQRDERGGDHVVGQGAALHEAQGVGGGDAVGGGHDVADEHEAAGVLAGGDRGVGDVRVVQEGGLHLAGFDAEPADLDLLVGPAEEFQESVAAPAGPVAGAVHALAGRAERVGEEAGGGESWPVQIAAGHLRPGEVQLAGRAGRYRAQGGVEDVRVRLPPGRPMTGRWGWSAQRP